MKISKSTAELLVVQERIFKEHFLKLLKHIVKTNSEDDKARKEVEDLATKLSSDLSGKDKKICLFVLSYLIASAFTVEEITEIETHFGNIF